MSKEKIVGVEFIRFCATIGVIMKVFVGFLHMEILRMLTGWYCLKQLMAWLFGQCRSL